MEHLEFFELPADPFQNDADARYYYESAPQKRARLRLLRGVHQRKVLSVMVGGPGLGKTTLAHVLLRTLAEKDYSAHYLSIPHESCSSGWFLPNVARAFGVPMPSEQVPRLIDQIHAQLVAISTARRTPVLLIDEAQLFRNRDAMEEFRGLLNLTHDGKRLLSMVLFGLPELDEILKLDPALAQRVEIRVEMTAMDWLESQAYVSHRLRLAGATQAVFSPDALESLFRWSGGVPRVLNTLADNSLFEGFLTETKPVDSPVVQRAAEALGLLRVPSDSVPNIPPVAAPAPDLFAAQETAIEPPARAERPRDTMPAAKPSPARRAVERAPEPEPEPEPMSELEEMPEPEAELSPVTDDLSAPDWLEPLSPMPADVPVSKPTPKSVEPELELADEEDLDLLEEVVPEDTHPPTPALTRVALKTPVAHELAEPEPEPEPEAEPEEANELELGMEPDDDGDFSLGSLVTGDDGGEEEAALADLGPASEPEPEIDLAPVRRTPPVAKPSGRPAARPMPPPTPAKPTPAPLKATPAKPSPAKVTPAKPAPAIPANNDDSFDLSSLVAEEDNTEPGPAALKPPAKDSDDDDLDALFDEIQIGDK
jgi:type II secretory pathway predicted ATPase ExeA